ncbi:MAG: hypothetical protein H6822_08945 [Planctomycetaceae bacterium]|nr:hypothetical protein [Planctomycetaceae bacterium]
MSEEFPTKRSLDNSSVEQLRQHMHAVERLNAETDYIRLQLTEYRQLDVVCKDLQAGADSLNDAADYLRDVLADLSERTDSTSTLKVR